MWKIFYTVEIIFIIGLIAFGELIGTKNIWFCGAVMIASHMVIDFLCRVYKSASYKPKKKRIITERELREHRKDMRIDIMI